MKDEASLKNMVDNTLSFEKVEIKYSWKNIPICSKKEYKIQLYQKTYKFIERLRWKAFFFNNKNNINNTNKGQNGRIATTNNNPHSRTFPTRRSAPSDNKLVKFEDALYNIVNNIKFKPYTNNFQNNMKKDLNKIEKSNKLFVFADKSNNLYKINKTNYEKILNNKVRSEYKISNKNTINKINDETYNLIKLHKVEGKIPKLQEKQAFITIKDHKETFPNKIEYRLLNPTKSFFAKYSKNLIDKINSTIRKNARFNQWKNTKDVINWFKNSKFNNNYRFIKFDIVKFYPSITKRTLIKAFQFAENFLPVTDKDINLIIQSCKSVLTHNNKTWEKINSDNLFNISMGSFNGAEICDLVGLFLLNELNNSNIFNNNEFGLYRDDALAILRSKSPRTAENATKKLIKLFKKFDFKITVESGLIQTDFLDVSFNILNSSYRPYNKPNSPILYVNNNSNHPKQILKQLPLTINQRLINLSNNNESFNNIKQTYQNSLNSANYKHKLTYEQPVIRKNNKRKRDIIYFNPPFNLNVATKIGKQFLNLINTYFDNNHPYRKIFNRNTIKISYSCTSNFKNRVIAHNNKILNESNPNDKYNVNNNNNNNNNNSNNNNSNNNNTNNNYNNTNNNNNNNINNNYNNNNDNNNNNNNNNKLCNCRKEPCPVSKKCLLSNLIYRATVKSKNSHKIYIGSTGNTFKQRYSNHKTTFLNKNKRHSTELANYVWKLKDSGTKFDIKWDILNTTKTKFNYRNGCKLCNLEKIEIDKVNKSISLNKRNERQSLCIHYHKYFFSKY